MRKILSLSILSSLLFVSSSFANNQAGNPDLSAAFVENIGQYEDGQGNQLNDLRFYLSSNGVEVYFFNDKVSYVFKEYEYVDGELAQEFRGHRIDMKWLGGSKDPLVNGGESVGSHRKYYRPGLNGITANEFSSIVYEGVWPNIDVRFTFDGKLKYDYILHPGADVNDIEFEYQGEQSTKLDGAGNIVIAHSLGSMTEGAPFTFDSKTRRELKSSYDFNSINGTFGVKIFGISQVGSEIVVDPVVSWGTFYGGGSNEGNLLFADVASDSQNDIYYVGNTGSTNFPVSSGAYQSSKAGGLEDAVVVKFDKAGNRKWATYMGGSSSDAASGVAVGAGDYVYFTGNTNSTDWPTTAGAEQGSFDAITDLIIVKMDSAGNLVWSTYFGASGTDDGNRLATSNDGHIYVVGNTTSPDLPVTNGAFQENYNNANEVLFTKFDTSGAMIWTTFIGGFQNDFGNGVTVSPDGGIYVTGTSASFDWYTSPGAYQTALNGSAGDAFVTKFNSAGTNLWSTFIGGTGDDVANGVGCDQFGNVYIGGSTQSSNFPTTSNAYQQSDANGINFSGFCAKFSSTGIIDWSTYFNGNSWERFLDLAVGPNNDVYLAGDSRSNNMPTTGDAYQGSFGGGFTDAILVKLDDTCGLAYSTYIGGNDQDYGRGVGVSMIDGSFFTSGYTVSSNFPTTGNVFQSSYGGGANDIFVYRFADCVPVTPVLSLFDTIGFCTGDSVLLDPGTNPSLTHAWSTGSSASSIYASTGGTYHVTVTDTGSCSRSDTVVVVVGTAPNAGINPSSSPTFCDGGDVTLVGAGATTNYQWYFNGAIMAGITADSITTNTPGAYTIVADPQLCSDSLSTPVNVVVNPNPTVDLGNDTLICGGSTLTLDAGFEAGATYLWSNFSTGDTLNVTTSGNYSVVEQFATGCSDSDNVTVNVTAGTVSSFPWSEDFESFNLCSTNNDCDSTVCPLGNNFINETNGQEDDIDWRVNEGPPPTQQGGFNTGPSMDHNPGTSAGNYVYIEASGGCNWEEAVMVSPCIDLSSLTAPELTFWYHMWGDDIGQLALDVWANGQWNNNVFGESGDQGNQWNKAIVSLLPYQGQLIRLRWSGWTNQGALADIALDDFLLQNVVDAPIANFVASTPNPCANDTVQFFDQSIHIPNAWAWSFSPSNVTFVGGTNANSASPKVIFGGTGTYDVTLIATNANGSDTLTKTSILEVVNPQGLPLFEDLETIANCATTFDCEVTECPLGNGFGNAQNGAVDDIDWRIHEGYTPTNQTGPQSGTDYNPGDTTGHYLYTEASFCSNREAHLLLPCIDFAGATDPLLDFWANMRGNAMGDLHVDAKVNGKWIEDLMTPISGSQGTQWFNVQVPLDSLVSQVGTIRIRGVTGGGSRSDICIDDIKVYEQIPPVANFSIQNPCAGDTTTFTDISNGFVNDWQWSFGAGAVPDSATGKGPHKVHYPSTGSYTVTLVASNNDGTDSITQTVNVIPTIPASVTMAQTGGQNPGCEGQSFTFSATPTNGGTTPQYDWKVSGQIMQSSLSPIFVSNALKDLDSVTVEMYSATTCALPSPTISPAVYMDLDSLPVAAFTFSVFGETATFTNTSLGGATSYLWDFGDGSSSTQTQTSHFYPTDGSYTVCLTATDSCGSDSVCQTVTVNCGYLAANFNKVVNGLSVTFTAPAGGATANYSWDFGDGSAASTQQNPVHTYAIDSVYLVCLIMADSACSDTNCENVGVGTVNINDPLNETGYMVFPNPAKDHLTIRWEKFEQRPDEIRFVNMMGAVLRRVKSNEISHMEHRLKVGSLPAGVYFVEVIKGDHRNFGKVVIDR